MLYQALPWLQRRTQIIQILHQPLVVAGLVYIDLLLSSKLYVAYIIRFIIINLVSR